MLETSSVHASEVNSQQTHCMARAIYGEAGNQSVAGKIMVGLVIRARAEEGGVWPSSFCGVVGQKNQFYGARRPYISKPENEQLAREIASGEYSFYSFEELGFPECVRFFATSNQSFMREVGWLGAHVFGCPNK